MTKTKIEIRSRTGSVLFSYEAEDNTVRKTLERANLRGAHLQYAHLQGAHLQGANLQYADLEGANLQDAHLQAADLQDAYLRGAYLRGAHLEGAHLKGANLQDADLQGAWVEKCKADMLRIFRALKKELPGLKKAIAEGRIDGSCHEGECACLIGTLAKLDGGIAKVCTTIGDYHKGIQNPAEWWFLGISPGDTPKNNAFAKIAVELIDQVMSE